jgi:hypothetical protein
MLFGGRKPSRIGANIHSFENSGFAAFEQPNNPRGPIPLINGERVLELIKVALARPEDLGLPFSHWSVKKLKAYCRDRNLLPPITDEWVRRLLRREGVSFQHSKTWKESPDPAFEVKKTASSISTMRRLKGTL